MASIQEREGARGTTYAVLYRADSKQRSRTFRDEASARKHAERIERLGVPAADRILDALTRPDPESLPTVTQQLKRHIAGLSGVQPDTITTYRTMTRQIGATTLGHLPIDAVTRDDVAGWIRGQEDAGVAGKTVRNRHAFLSAGLARAVVDGTLTRNPAFKVRMARTERREMTFLTPAEFEILRVRATEHYRPLLMFLYGTGLRLGEATALRIGDLHLDDTPATLTVARAWKKGNRVGPPKTKAGRRTISIPGPVVDVVRPIIAGRGPDELVFLNTAGRRVLQGSLHDLWQGWVADTVLDRRTGTVTKRTPALGKRPRIHDLRHSHASQMIARGVNLFDLMHRLGHENITTTANVYGHLLPEAQVQAERAAALAFTAQVPQIGG